MSPQPLNTEKQLPSPHDMQLPMSHWQLLRKPTFSEKYRYFRWLLILLLLPLLFFLPVPYYQNKVQCPTDPVSPCPKEGFYFGLSLWEQVIMTRQISPNNEIYISPTAIPLSPKSSSNELIVIDLAKKDLAARLKINTEEIQIQSYKEVNWNDSSLGCAKPGMNYLQVITPGYEIILEANDQEYSYHTNTQTRVVLCDLQ